MLQSTNRIQTYSSISTELSCLSNAKLAEILEKSPALHSGIGGKSVLLDIKGNSVFVKKIPLTELELKSENIMSTANIFKLPLFCQYGIGSPGFSAWRELAANIMTTNWVLSGKCEYFPMLYHWRILDTAKAPAMNTEQLENLENEVTFWENSNELRNRLESLHNSSAQLILFLEYIPENLLTWLSNQFTKSEKVSESALNFVEKNLNFTNTFMKENGLLHFDAHFENILTDGKQLYFTDFGLALSNKFDLSDEEIKFMSLHQNYDYCRSAVGLIHCISASFFEKDMWVLKLREYLQNNHPQLPLAIAGIIKKYAPVALAIIDFSRKLRDESKYIPYPVEQLNNMLTEIKLLNTL